MEKKKEDSIGKLEEGLYSRNSDQVTERVRRELNERDFGVSEEWKPQVIDEKMKKKKITLKSILFASVVFFGISVLLASYFFINSQSISPDKVNISVDGPALIGGGDELSFQLEITNINPVAIESVNLIVEYPSGTRAVTNIDTELLRDVHSLGTIEPGDKIDKTIKAILFGEENSKKEIKIIVEYRTQNSSGTFYNDYIYELALSSSPLSLVIESLEEAISGQEIEFSATVSSNSGEIVKDVLLSVDYPFGFKFISSDPEPIFADSVWNLGDIPPEGKKKITFKGSLAGQDGEERVFRFSTGLQSENDENVIGAVFIDIAESLLIKRPFLTTNLALDGSSTGDHVVNGGKRVRADITWLNNLTTQIFDGEIEVSFEGQVLDRLSVSADSGFYKSIDNKIIWDRSTYDKLATIPAGGSGRVSFSFEPLGITSGIAFRNPEINLDVTVRGKRLSENNVPETIESTLKRKIKVSSDLSMISKVLHFTGPFQNIGPMPPIAEQETTYTITWNVLNSSNQLSDTQVTASLPSYVEWTGQVSPASEVVEFNPVGGLITWKLGDVSPGTGSTLSAREVSFQIKLIPSVSQIRKAPILMNTQTVTGFDRFVEKTISATKSSLNIRISDPGYNPNSYSNVVE